MWRTSTDDIRRRLGQIGTVGHDNSKNIPSAPDLPMESSTTSTVLYRYRDAYRVGSALVGLGNAIKVIGGCITALIVVASFGSADTFGGSVALFGLIVGAITGAVFWVYGVIVSAQGQILLATL